MRNKIIDISKGILIVLMVIGHSGAPFTEFIYLFHMTAFLFLSGFVFNGNQTLKNFFNRRILQGMYFPFVRNNILFTLFYPILYYYGLMTINIDFNFKQFLNTILNIMFLGGGINELVGPLWYLVLLIEASTLYYFLNKVLKNLFSLSVTIFIIFFLGFLLLRYNIFLPRYLGVTLIVVSFIHLGRCFSVYYSLIRYNFLLAITLFFVLFIISQYIKINIGISNFGNPILYIISSLCGIYLVLFLANFIGEKTNFTFFSFIGQRTLSILVWHLFFFKILTLYLVFNGNYSLSMLKSFPVLKATVNYLWIFYTLIGLLGPLFLSFCTEKVLFIFNKIKN